MSGRLLLFGGTTEGREILGYGIPAICCVATGYGAEMLRGVENAEIRVGRLDAEQMAGLINGGEISCVIDATHPYAVEVTANIKRACAETGTPMRRVLRPPSAYGRAIVADSCEAAAGMLNDYSGKVLLTTGSKDMAAFTAVKDFRERFFVRVLPLEEAVARAEELGFKREHVIAAKGPFTAEENEQTLRRTGAEIIVTKDGGAPGGITEKLRAAEKLGVRVIVVARPGDEGCSVRQAVFWARRVMGITRPPLFPMYADIEKQKIVVVGGGPVALRRAATLMLCGASVTVIAPEILPELTNTGCRILERRYRDGDLSGAAMAVAATGDREVNSLVAAEAKKRGIPVNVADAAENCDFFFPSMISRDGITVSLSSAGVSPGLTKLVSGKIREALPRLVREAKEACLKNREGANDIE